MAQSSADKEMRKIPNNENLKVMKAAHPLGLFVGLFICIVHVKWRWTAATQAFFSITEVATGAGEASRPKIPWGWLHTVTRSGTASCLTQEALAPEGTSFDSPQPGGVLPRADSPGLARLFLSQQSSRDHLPLKMVSQGVG